jgi:hypothetical protein
MMERFRRTAITSTLIVAASIALLAGCASTGTSVGSAPTATANPEPKAPIINVPGALPGEVARTTFDGTGFPKAVAVAPTVAGVNYVVKAQCASTQKADALTYQVLIGDKPAVGAASTGSIVCDGTPLLAPTVALPVGSNVTVSLSTPGAAVKKAFAILQPSQ